MENSHESLMGKNYVTFPMGYSWERITIPSIDTEPGMSRHEMGIITVRHRPPCVYPLSTWHDHTWPDLWPFPSIFAYGGGTTVCV